MQYIVQLLTFIFLLLTIFLEHKITNKAFKSYKLIFRVLIVVASLTFLFSLALTWNQNNESNKRYEETKANFDELKEKNDLLAELLMPFEEYAKNIYPDFETKEALNKVIEDLNETNKVVKSTQKEIEKHKYRILNPENEKKIINILKNGPKGNINIQTGHNAGDEVEAFKAQIEKILSASGWEITGYAMIPLKSSATGLYVVVQNNISPPKRAIFLIATLMSFGVDVIGVYNSALSSEQVIIKIARKRYE